MTTETTKKQAMYEKIERHGNNLNAIFNTGVEPIALCKKLRRLEIKANKLAEDYCNGDISTDEWPLKTAPILAAVRKILYPNGMTGDAKKDWCIFLNGDARGYALKINDDYVRDNNLTIHRDWGGYGIIAPDFSNDNS